MYKLLLRTKGKDPVLSEKSFDNLHDAREASFYLEDVLIEHGFKSLVSVIETGTKPSKEKT